MAAKKTSPAARETPASTDPLADLMAALQELQTSSAIDPALGEQVAALASNPQQLMALLTDPQLMEKFAGQLEAVGAHEMGSGRPMEIADYYREGPGRYELRWPLDPSLPMPGSFEQLDRKTQFFLLFSEWSRREMQGISALTFGDVDAAGQIFEECLERAGQIDVAELKARSYEGLMRVAQKRGDLEAESRWEKAAQAARA